MEAECDNMPHRCTLKRLMLGSDYMIFLSVTIATVSDYVPKSVSCHGKQTRQTTFHQNEKALSECFSVTFVRTSVLLFVME